AEVRSKGSARKTGIIGNAMEAVIGAVYLDAGLTAVEALARRVFGSALLPSAPRAPRDAKTRFQELVMERYREFPTYELLGDSGSEDDEERFSVVARVQGEAWGKGAGRSKRRAEHAAAERGLALLDSADE
ncbi:MAG: putative dsRNA-binding protein, partial [Myxococcota bacterium]